MCEKCEPQSDVDDDDLALTSDMIGELHLEANEEEDSFAAHAEQRFAKMVSRYGFPAGPARKVGRDIGEAGRVGGARQRQRIVDEVERDFMRQMSRQTNPDQILN